MTAIDITLGIDIGGTNSKIGLVDKNGNCLNATSISTGADEPVEKFLPRLFSAADELIKAHDTPVNVKAVGMGAPNGNYYKGTIEQAPNLNWGEIVPIATLVEEHFKIPTVLTNDANAAAIGEMKFGAAQGMRNFIVITLGTGLGSGIVVNGDLVYGHDGFAGEIGHTTVFLDGRDHTTGRKGSLETYVSATGIKRTFIELMGKMVDPSVLRSKPVVEITAKDIADEAEKGDKVALATFDYTAKILGLKLSDTVAHLSPEAIILFGGVTAAHPDLLLNPTKKYMEEYNLGIFKDKVKLLVSSMGGANAAVLGAGALAWQELDKR